MIYVRTPYYRGQENPELQPVQFDHRHHVADDHIDCRFCHQTVEVAASAGYPSTETCMYCHSQIWTASPLLDVVRQSYFKGVPIPWNRIHRLPQYVYFNHSIHVGKGVGCVTCHGRVDQMPLEEQVAPLTMGWCLDCHRNPNHNLRPKQFITDMTWAAADPVAEGNAVAQQVHVKTRTSCTTCHR